MRNGIKKNGKTAQRSPENNQKAALLRPELYNKLISDNAISFCFSEDATIEKTDEYILKRWAERNYHL
ncbi:DUF6037 family protein [Bacillus sp. RAR_GA_16]|uniref:DUF6037 family protein n=1 Tax=Bacillus sp. RAR_GA_16 TaxID=2876774 RepID=UPI001CCD9BF1|nr:DUF6037 family protein [Bacillus sp. RAR_GA_16]